MTLNFVFLMLKLWHSGPDKSHELCNVKRIDIYYEG